MGLGDGTLGRCLGHEGRDLMNGISILTKEASERSILCSAVGGHREKRAISEPGNPQQTLNWPAL